MKALHYNTYWYRDTRTVELLLSWGSTDFDFIFAAPQLAVNETLNYPPRTLRWQGDRLVHWMVPHFDRAGLLHELLVEEVVSHTGLTAKNFERALDDLRRRRGVDTCQWCEVAR